MSTRTVKHGTINEYANYKCRCAECRKVWNEDCKRLRRRRIANGICVECIDLAENGHVRCAKHHARMLIRARTAQRKSYREGYSKYQLRREMEAW
jgi:hypothetical protein